ncbi:MAG TPA: ATPase, T2SS/T4P/T4SS family [Verrucomicrobiota bacterium]|jgi:type II secretory ATPase GspE/PulE/Tfp pilus assembly ATPase PilB-like protein|nr:ATPase, T2SS/T4P/T4SS family [Verrucomicrobiota bacterium]HQL79787.1 ATPase, T2SS/T4P/T4SS family [Verrucomicrobiota bacterium]
MKRTDRKPTDNDHDDADEPAPQTLERLIAQAEKAGASDIHLQMLPDGASVTFRLDGVMTPTSNLPAALAHRVFGRIKFLARLKTYLESTPQDGRIDRAAVNSRTEIRVATYPTISGEKIVLRLFDTTQVRSLVELAFPDPARAELEGFLNQTAGLLLLTGPAGSGKTTTIYACLRHLAAQGGRHVITVEDPAEQVVPGIMQTEVSEARGLGFARAARHLLRQDPQVLVIGEIRDEETAEVAVRAGLTGHLVVSTLHAGSCQGVFERLLALCPDRSAAVSTLELVLNQRLLRRRCSLCAGKGCPDCLSTGYRGRVPLVEWVRLTPALRRRVAARDLEGLGAHPALAQGARELVQAGVTDEAEVARVLGSVRGAG